MKRFASAIATLGAAGLVLAIAPVVDSGSTPFARLINPSKAV